MIEIFSFNVIVEKPSQKVGNCADRDVNTIISPRVMVKMDISNLVKIL